MHVVGMCDRHKSGRSFCTLWHGMPNTTSSIINFITSNNQKPVMRALYLIQYAEHRHQQKHELQRTRALLTGTRGDRE